MVDLAESDILSFQEAIRLANEAEMNGNLPIGAVITLEDRIIAAGKNAIWSPVFNPNRHAEIEAMRQVPEQLWVHSRDMTLYTTLEPCLMCMGAILLHRVGRVLYGAADHYGGASQVSGHLPTFFADQFARIEWQGPAYPGECNGLFERVMAHIEKRESSR